MLAQSFDFTFSTPVVATGVSRSSRRVLRSAARRALYPEYDLSAAREISENGDGK